MATAPEPPHGDGADGRFRWLMGLALAVVTSVAFLPTLRNGFAGWDDTVNFLTNRDFRCLSWKSLRWAWTTYLMGVYQPLGWMIHECQYVVWGMSPRWYHLSSILFHAANAVALWVLTRTVLERVDPAVDRRASAVASAVAVALFAVHPLRVEAVAWASCQTYLPSILFAILSVTVYLRACDTPRSSTRLAAAWILFGLALLTKVAVVSLPAVLLILDVYPLRRLGPGRWTGPEARRVYAEKMAFLALAVPFMVAAVQARWPYEIRPQVGITDLGPRLAQSFYGVWFYTVKTIFPFGISAYYPLPARPSSYFKGPFLAAAVATFAACAAAYRFRRRWPGLAAAWACYLVCVGPSLGIIRTSMSVAADRYSYVASMSGVIVLAYALTRLARHPNPRAWRLALAVAAVLVVVLSALTWRQCRTWRTMQTLWAQAGFDGRVHYEGNLKLGIERNREGRLAEAKLHLLQALTDLPESAPALVNLGTVYWKEGKPDEAEEMWGKALDCEPDCSEAEFVEAVRIDPKSAEARYNLGRSLACQGKDDPAIVQFSAAVRLRPGYADAHVALGSALARVGLIDEASAEFEAALRAMPYHPEALRERARLTGK